MNSEDFDPSGPGTGENIFGLPVNQKNADLVIIPIPWDGTVSYHEGTAKGPQAVFNASFQVDLEDPFVKDAWKNKLFYYPVSEDLIALNQTNKHHSKLVSESFEVPNKYSTNQVQSSIDEVNSNSEKLNLWIYNKCQELSASGKIPVVLGGEHSCPIGLLKHLGEKHSEFGILQIDAHMDLRKAYMGYQHSHASIMYNALKINEVTKLIQVGIRDYCLEEKEFAQSNGRIITWYDHAIFEAKINGVKYIQLIQDMIKPLPDKVYISFDIDGLSPDLCPNTGTPVPGGLSFQESLFLVKEIVASGRQIIGFDLCEVTPGSSGDWDANVGARILYRLCNLLLKSNGNKSQ